MLMHMYICMCVCVCLHMFVFCICILWPRCAICNYMCGMYGMRCMRIVRTCIRSGLAMHLAGAFKRCGFVGPRWEPVARRFRVACRLPRGPCRFRCTGIFDNATRGCHTVRLPAGGCHTVRLPAGGAGLAPNTQPGCKGNDQRWGH